MNLNKVKESRIEICGDTNKRGDCLLEIEEQVLFLKLLKVKYPALSAIAVHIKNEGKRSLRQGKREKAQGLIAGAPDIVIPCNPPLLIELKRANHTKSTISDKQLAYLANAQDVGAKCCIALGADAAIEFIDRVTGGLNENTKNAHRKTTV